MSTFPRILARHAAERPRAVALQEKRFGIWQPLTWAEYAARVRDVAYGLATLGVRRGEVVGVLGDNRPEWLIAELAAQCLGAAVVGLHPTSAGDEIQRALAGVRVVVAEDQEQVDKLIRVKDRLPALERVVHFNGRGLERYPEPYLARLADVEAAGRRDAAARPAWLDAEIARGEPGDTAVVCGTARLSHASLLATADQLHAIDPLDRGHRYVSFLPLAWLGEQLLAVACGLRHGLTVSFPEAPATQRADLREIGPDVMLGPPRIWAEMQAGVQERLDRAGGLSRRVFAWAHGVGAAVAALRTSGRRPGPALAARHRLADAVALRPVRDQLGLARIRRCYTGGAPLSPDVLRFFHALGVNLKQMDGPTEVCGAP